MVEVLERVLENGAGKIIYVHPASEETFISKTWRVLLELDGEWARKALALDFQKVRRELKKRRYKESPHWPVEFRCFYKNHEEIYIFLPEEGGLVRGIIQLARDYDANPRTAKIVPYHDTNIDLKCQQDFLIEKVLEYVQIINVLI